MSYFIDFLFTAEINAAMAMNFSVCLFFMWISKMNVVKTLTVMVGRYITRNFNTKKRIFRKLKIINKKTIQCLFYLYIF